MTFRRILARIAPLVMGILLQGIPLPAQDNSREIKDFSELEIETLLDRNVTVATRSSQTIQEAPGIVTVITAEDIRNLGARDLRDVLRTVPGFELGISGLGYTCIGIRGVMTSNSEKVKFLLDGIPVNEHLEGGGAIMFADFPLENVDRIEVIRGPGSALYGTGAFVGVIHIFTQTGGKAEGFRAGLSGGSFGTLRAYVSASRRVSKRFKYAFLANVSHTDGPIRPVEQDILSHDPLNSGVSLAGTQDGQTLFLKNKMTLVANLDYGEFFLRSSFIDQRQRIHQTTAGALAPGSRPHTLQGQMLVGYAHRFGERLLLEGSLYDTFYQPNNLWNTHPSGYRMVTQDGTVTEYPQGKYQKDGASQNTTGADARLTWNVHTRHCLVLGASLENIRLFQLVSEGNEFNPLLGPENLANIPPIMKRPSITRRIVSCYAQEQWHITDALDFTGGIRLDRYNDAGTTVNPRAALVWHPEEVSTVKFIYGRAFREPTFVESYLWALGGFARGNENIRPETIQTWEAEVSRKFGEHVQARVNAYANRIRNLISFSPVMSGSTLDHLEYRNQGNLSTIQGLEGELKVYFLNNRSSAYANFSWQDGKNRGTGEHLYGVARHLYHAGANLEIRPGWTLNLDMTRVGKRCRSTTDNRLPLDGYTFLSANIRAAGLREHLNLSLGVFNILGSDMRYADNSMNFTRDYPMEGRSVHAQLSWDW